jgi:hypothetical protein
MPVSGSQQFLEFLHTQSGIANDPAHGYCVHRIIPRDGNKSVSVGHHDVLAFPNDPEASFF